MSALVCFTAASVLPILAITADDTGDGYSDETDKTISSLQSKLDQAQQLISQRDERIKNGQNELENQKKAVEAGNKAIDDLKKMVNDLETKEVAAATAEALSSILPQGVGEDAEKKTLDITDIIKQAAEDFKKAADEAGIEIKIIEPDTPMYVCAAPIMLRTMFRDIIDNALKYMQRTGTLQVTVANLDDDIFVAMKDNGKGLAESETAHIFELNFQGSNRISGNGLGLAQVKAIVEHYGGMIYAKSSPGRGMGIYLHLPAERV